MKSDLFIIPRICAGSKPCCLPNPGFARLLTAMAALRRQRRRHGSAPWAHLLPSFRHASVDGTNGTSLSRETLQTLPGIQEKLRKFALAFDTFLANTALFNHVQGSPHFRSVSARLARYQLYRGPVAATGSISAILAADRTGPCHAAPEVTRTGRESCSRFGVSSSSAPSSNIFTTACTQRDRPGIGEHNRKVKRQHGESDPR